MSLNKCNKCLKPNAEGSAFCSNCGTKLQVKSSAPERKKLQAKTQSKSPKIQLPNFREMLPKTSQGKVLGGAGAVTVLLVFGILLLDSTPVPLESNVTADTSQNYESIKDDLQAAAKPDLDCSNLKVLVDNEPYFTIASKQIKRAKKAASRLTVWNAEDYLANNSWTQNSRLPDMQKPYIKFVRAATDPLLDKTVQKLPENQQEAFNSNATDDWYANFAQFSLESCGLRELVEDNEGVVRDFESALVRISSLASQKPWYPKGFSEISNFPGFAYENISNQGCTFSYGSCAKFKIVSEFNCPTNLYVQTNALSGGAVVDWSNDTAIVRAGQVAVMETSFSVSAGTWEFVEINCY